MTRWKTTLAERIAAMTPEEFAAAGRAMAAEDRRLKAAGLLEVVDDRAEVYAIMEERLPVLHATLDSEPTSDG